MRITEEHIDRLADNEVFVFGSNRSGIHGAGAAKTAMNKFGAVYGVGEGLTGQCYALPTVSHGIKRSLNLDDIKEHIEKFSEFAKSRKDLTFLVTKVGCGLGGYNPELIAPLFYGCIDLDNVYLPKEFVEILNENIIK